MSNLNSEWAQLIVEELVRLGVDTFVASPGSRSTPLVAAIGRHPRARCIVHTDERGAAFFALGYARAKGRPAPFVCTSGSALANALPAVVEGYQDRVPMLLLTADRPPELIGNGANQSIQQRGLFSSFTVSESHLPPPTRDLPAEFVLTTVDHAFYRTSEGPVHLNCAFRKPLEPVPVDTSYFLSVSSWAEGDHAYTTCHRPERTLKDFDLQPLCEAIELAERPLLTLGRLALPAGSLDTFIQSLQWPTFPDILSGYRLGYPHHPLVHDFDSCLDEWEPDLILQLGEPPLSLRLQEAMRRWQVPTWQVTNHDRRHDPVHRVTNRIEANILSFANSLVEKLSYPHKVPLERLRCGRAHPFTELSRDAEEGDGLWLANSMTIRLMAEQGAIDGPRLFVGGNRGASGIDGTIASACGFAQGLRRPVTLILGDLAFLHDVSSLPLVARSNYPIRVVVFDDNGGGIFERLPIAQQKDLFETFFKTPHNLNLKAIASAYGVTIQTLCPQEKL